MAEKELVEDTSKEIPHHQQQELCSSRPPYRQGRKLTAVKVYTVASESQHLCVYGVPKINLRNELKSLFSKYGQISKIHVLEDRAVEIFTECYHIQFQRIQSARIAKRLVDNKSFYGGILHVCYAPEFETLEETISKLQQREKDVLTRLARQSSDFKQPIPTISPVEYRTTSRTAKKQESCTGEGTDLYDADDPILSLNKKLKSDHAVHLQKYLSQSNENKGGPIRSAPKKILNAKKFVPSTLRGKKESTKPQNEFIGPQLPESDELEFLSSSEFENLNCT